MAMTASAWRLRLHYLRALSSINEIAGPRASPMPNQEPLAFAHRAAACRISSRALLSIAREVTVSNPNQRNLKHAVDWQGRFGHGGAAGDRPCDGARICRGGRRRGDQLAR